MGRRSINTTKSGKYMNPTDQARKEARKQELKKNKKQRQMVRAAVLKGKDPQQLLEEMEKIDQMEFNVNQPSPLNEKVLKDKRKKLRDTLERVLSMYHKDDPEKWSDLKRRQTDYEHKRNQLVAFYESVKSAQQVTVDEIPLPQLPQQPIITQSLQIPLPIEARKPEHTIYSIATALKLQALGKPIREPPGCPPGPPPDINSDGEVEEFEQEEISEQQQQQHSAQQEREKSASPTQEPAEVGIPVKPTSLQQKMVAISGQNVDDFMKEMEVAQKKMESDKEEDQTLPQPRPKPVINIESPAPPGIEPEVPIKPPVQPSHPMPPLVMFPGPGPMRVPPGPPPGRPMLPPGPPPGLPPPRLSLRMPHPPSRLIRIPGPPPIQANIPQPNLLGTPNVLSAAPQLISRSDPNKSNATIMAKPQIRNLSADVTRFVPSTLRVKREDKKPKPSRAALINELRQKDLMTQNMQKQPTKDDAYLQFMKEMQGLL